jgi:MFS family permease
MEALRSLCAAVGDTVTAQRELVVFLWNDPRFRPPLIVIWVASFGGALHAPVTTFFCLKVGATDEDLGMIGLFWNFGGLFMPPFYGWLLDTRGGYLPMMISIVLCSVGCLVRGLATNVTELYIAAAILGLGGINLWTTVCSYIAANTPPERRSLVVSGYLFQVTSVRIVGTSLYPLWYRGLTAIWPGEDDEISLFRDRLSMGVCTFFCFFGLFELLFFGAAVRGTRPLAETKLLDAEHQASSEAEHGQSNKEQQRSRARSPSPASPGKAGRIYGDGGWFGPFVVVCLALCSQSMAHSVGSTLWPLFVRDRFGWSSAEFSYLLMVSSVCSTASVAALPTFEATLGRVRTAALAMSTAGFFSFAAFAIASGGSSSSSEGAADSGGDGTLSAAILAHGGAAVLFFAAIALLEPSLKSLASTTRAASEGGRSFGILASVIAFGNSVGSVFGTRLYAATKDAGYVDAGGAEHLPLHDASADVLMKNASSSSSVGVVTPPPPEDGWLFARQPQLAQLIVPGALPFVVVSVLLVVSAVCFVIVDGTDGWLLGRAEPGSGGNDGSGGDGDGSSEASGSGRGKGRNEPAAVVGGGEGKAALGPPGKTI